MKKLIFIIFIYVYILFFLGLVLHSSLHPQILGKYTIRYLIFLIVLVVGFWPFIQFLHFSQSTSQFKVLKKKITLSPGRKLWMYVFIFIFVLLIPTEVFI